MRRYIFILSLGIISLATVAKAIQQTPPSSAQTANSMPTVQPTYAYNTTQTQHTLPPLPATKPPYPPTNTNVYASPTPGGIPPKPFLNSSTNPQISLYPTGGLRPSINSSLYPSGYPYNRPGLSGTPNPMAGNNLLQCQKIQQSITSSTGPMTAFIKNYQTLTSIFSGIQNFYTQKVAPSGVSLPYYTQLVSQTQTAQSSLLTSIQSLQSDINSLTCTTSFAQEFTKLKTDYQATITATGAFKDAIKNLVNAIKTVAQNMKDTQTVTPTGTGPVQ